MKQKVLLLCYNQFLIDDSIRVPKYIDIYVVTSLEIAFELLEEIEFEAVFTELKVCKDKLAGYKLMKYARDKSKNQNVSIYAIGLDKVNACRGWAKQIGFDDFFGSPNNYDLLQQIKRLLKESNQAKKAC